MTLKNMRVRGDIFLSNFMKCDEAEGEKINFIENSKFPLVRDFHKSDKKNCARFLQNLFYFLCNFTSGVPYPYNMVVVCTIIAIFNTSAAVMHS